MSLFLRFKIYAVVFVLTHVAAVTAQGASPTRVLSFEEHTPSELDRRAAIDGVLLLSYARSADVLAGSMARAEEIWRKPKTAALSADERQQVLDIFEQVVAHLVALDAMARFHFNFWRIDPIKEPARHARHFATAFAAYCLKVRLALLLVDRTLNKPQFEILFDDVDSHDL